MLPRIEVLDSQRVLAEEQYRLWIGRREGVVTILLLSSSPEPYTRQLLRRMDNFLGTEFEPSPLVLWSEGGMGNFSIDGRSQNLEPEVLAFVENGAQREWSKELGIKVAFEPAFKHSEHHWNHNYHSFGD